MFERMERTQPGIQIGAHWGSNRALGFYTRTGENTFRYTFGQNAKQINSISIKSMGYENVSGGYFIELSAQLSDGVGWEQEAFTFGGGTEIYFRNEFGNDFDRLKRMPGAFIDFVIHDAGAFGGPTSSEGGDGTEGKAIPASHTRYERKGAIVEETKAAHIAKHGRLHCVACSFSFEEKYGEFGKGYIECHHLRPLADGVRPSDATQLVCLCANCHRVIHVIINRNRDWPTALDQLRDSIQRLDL